MRKGAPISSGSSNFDINITLTKAAKYIFITIAKWTRAEGNDSIGIPTYTFTNGTGTIDTNTHINAWSVYTIISNVTAGTTINSSLGIYLGTSFADIYIIY